MQHSKCAAHALGTNPVGHSMGFLQRRTCVFTHLTCSEACTAPAICLRPCHLLLHDPMLPLTVLLLPSAACRACSQAQHGQLLSEQQCHQQQR
jgi:hypothetical protein